MDEFYDSDILTIDKINLIQISNDLGIPKETIRRKVNELQSSNNLTRRGKTIIFDRKGIETQKPNDMIELLSTFIDKKSKMLQGQDWFGSPLSKDYIKSFIKKYFTIVWLRFFRMQIPFLTRHRKVFGDLETWIVWGNIGLSHQYQLAKAAEKNLITSEITLKSYYSNVADVKFDRGVNASSIADISSLPRATVIRKLSWLVSQNGIKKNKNLEYQMKKGGKLNAQISENFLLNQHSVAEFLTDIFDFLSIKIDSSSIISFGFWVSIPFLLNIIDLPCLVKILELCSSLTFLLIVSLGIPRPLDI